jgi:hypothetical protein
MELIEFSEDNIVKPLFDAKKDPIEIWKNEIEYSRLRQHARKMFSCFSTTYCRQSTFSYMTQINAVKAKNYGYPSRGSAETADFHAATKYSNSFLQKAVTTTSLKD